MSDKLSPMQEQLLGQASNILQSVSDTVSKATDLAAAQLPDIAMQYVTYGRVSSTVMVLIGLVGFIFLGWVIFSVCFKNKYDIRGADNRGFIAFISTVVFGIPSFICFAGNINTMIMSWVAPKVWLIKEIVGLVK